MTDPVSESDPFHLSGSVLDGRFHVMREVAEGGFGVVYHAIQTTLDRPVAIKVLKTPQRMTEDARARFHERFAGEAKTIARIRHPNIVDVYDFGISVMPSGERAPWMALEWLDGRTLEDHLATRRGRGGQAPRDVLGLLRPVMRACAFAHREGIAHRDIKPANLMVVSADGGASTADTGQLVRILDFGIAKVMSNDESPGSGHTRTASLPAFSPQYAAPEQIAYGRTGPWTDVHALGLLVTEMLVDETPYQDTDIQLFEAVMAPGRPTPASKGRAVGPWENVLARALALSPGERWKTAGDLLAALEASVEAATLAFESDARVSLAAPRRTMLLPSDAEAGANTGAPSRTDNDHGDADAADDDFNPSSQTKPAKRSPSRDAKRARRSDRARPPGGRSWRATLVVAGLAGASALVLAVVLALLASNRRGHELPVAEQAAPEIGTHEPATPAAPAASKEIAPTPPPPAAMNPEPEATSEPAAPSKAAPSADDVRAPPADVPPSGAPPTRAPPKHAPRKTATGAPAVIAADERQPRSRSSAAAKAAAAHHTLAAPPPAERGESSKRLLDLVDDRK